MSWLAHWSLGIAPAALRGIMAEGGMRGPLVLGNHSPTATRVVHGHEGTARYRCGREPDHHRCSAFRELSALKVRTAVVIVSGVRCTAKGVTS